MWVQISALQLLWENPERRMRAALCLSAVLALGVAAPSVPHVALDAKVVDAQEAVINHVNSVQSVGVSITREGRALALSGWPARVGTKQNKPNQTRRGEGARSSATSDAC